MQRTERTASLNYSRTRVAGVLLVVSHAALAQSPDSATQKTFFVPRDAAVAAAFFAASAGLSIFDVRLAHFFEDTAHIHVRAGQKLDDIFTHINETTLTVGSLAVYAVARVAKQETVADIAFHTASSVVAASLTAQVIRGPLGRTRPRDADPPYDDQYDFHFMKGFSNFKNRAFPSIHSSSGFAAAAALVTETKIRSPAATWYVAIPAYALAATPGLSRMYLGQHWASDIVAGAFFGTFYGMRVVDYSHKHERTKVDRLFLGPMKTAQLSPMDGGYSVSWSFRF